jgi:hypothetical protein
MTDIVQERNERGEGEKEISESKERGIGRIEGKRKRRGRRTMML